MASKRKVTQDDLRKMMADIKSNPTKSTSKKLKLSARELALIEEEKRQKALRDQEKIRLKQEKMARIVPNQSLQPKKSILKNSGSTSNYVPPSLTPYQLQAAASEKKQISIQESPQQSSAPVQPTKKVVEEKEPDESGELPEGFFDDPKLDAKARNVQYVDQEEEEWNKFQKEIAEEEATAQEILVEDRNEATADRQLEDIDEQIQAWKRVAQLEEKKEAVSSKAVSKSKQEDSDEEVESDVELDALTDWRKKS